MMPSLLAIETGIGLFLLVIIAMLLIVSRRYKKIVVKNEETRQWLKIAFAELEEQKALVNAHLEKELLALNTTLELSQQVALHAVSVADKLAERAPTILSLDYVRENLYPEFDPSCMKAVYVSFCELKHADSFPEVNQTHLTVLCGKEPNSVVGDKDYFMRAYSSDNTLRIRARRSSVTADKLSDWHAIMTIIQAAISKTITREIIEKVSGSKNNSTTSN